MARPFVIPTRPYVVISQFVAQVPRDLGRCGA